MFWFMCFSILTKELTYHGLDWCFLEIFFYTGKYFGMMKKIYTNVSTVGRACTPQTGKS